MFQSHRHMPHKICIPLCFASWVKLCWKIHLIFLSMFIRVSSLYWQTPFLGWLPKLKSPSGEGNHSFQGLTWFERHNLIGWFFCRKRFHWLTQSTGLNIIALWWWFCPCRVGGAVWNHMAWLFPLMPLPTEFLFYSYFLSRNKYRINITCKNIGQFHFCINLLPLALIWRSAPCLKHWNQRWFGDAAFTIPSGKQWDHMSPWSPSWLSAGIDECCRSANESGHQWFKRVG